MRIGGETCLYLQGVAMGISKVRKWEIDAVNIYLYFDDIGISGARKHFKPAQGVLIHLKLLEIRGGRADIYHVRPIGTGEGGTASTTDRSRECRDIRC